MSNKKPTRFEVRLKKILDEDVDEVIKNIENNRKKKSTSSSDNNHDNINKNKGDE